MSNTEYKTEIKTVAEIFAYNFNIPVYQRLYVWGDAQIETLFEDLYSAFQHNKEDIYYLGSIVVVENNDKFDLIDGQQRFTTLSILRDVLGDMLDDNKLSFAIRDNVWSEFKEKQSDNADIKRMIRAKTIFNKELTKISEKEEFKKFVNNQVKLNFISIPGSADLNKIFELINGRGEQLLQHEILKAKILVNANDECKSAYGKIWDIVANIDECIEVNIKNSIFEDNKNITWNDYFNKRDNYLNFSELVERLDSDRGQTVTGGLSIVGIINKNEIQQSHNTQSNNNDNEDDDSKYLSIISFATFLLYALVAYKKQDYFKTNKELKIQFKETNLIAIFKNFVENKEFCQEFVEFLFDFRVKFDKYIIKNKISIGQIDNETNHNIYAVKQNGEGSKTTKQIEKLTGSNDLALLQSMLYHAHTRQTQEWIIPFLNNISNDSNLELLKNIDNQLYSVIDADNTVLQRANNYSNQPCDTDKIVKYINTIPETNYHHFSRYWFYKMDWIIYCYKNNEKITIPDGFKFSARNSIEHISPQTENTDNTDKPIEKLHSFGNLALMSGNDNSSFSNLSFWEKKAKFKEDNTNLKNNLKLAMIFKKNGWGEEESKKHLDECTKSIKQYFKIK